MEKLKTIFMVFLKFLLFISTCFLFSCSGGGNGIINQNPSGCMYGSALTDIDGNIYTTVKIGKQEWMGENLKVTKYRDGTPIPSITNQSQWVSISTGAYGYYKDNSVNNTPFGKIYNWYAVNNSHILAPLGWHIPSDAEWDTLVSYLGGNLIAGNSLKQKGITYWATENAGIGGVTNNTCFTALPLGCSIGGCVIGDGNNGTWWSSTDAGTAGAWFFALAANNGGTDHGTAPKFYGYSIRCIKD